ncbi:MAG: response regulator transcription factor [Sulfurovum sp.]|nr:response regulator transcription factor [Sulfurovum sp.]
MVQILMIEDDIEFATLLTNYLNGYNINVTNYADPYLGLSAGIEKYDLLILDLTLPGIDGLDVCQEVCEKYDIPIIISSARSDLSDKVLGLKLGADDYLPKPYEPQELYARIQSLLRRYNKLNTEPKNSIDKLEIDKSRQVILWQKEDMNLTPAEYEVLQLLIKNRGNTISKEQILYDSDIFQESNDNSLFVIMSRLRKKLDSSITIKSVRGIGYRLS